jgi:uncharacterized protein (TIGR03435 family)
VRSLIVTLWIASAVIHASGQSQAIEAPRFEVASIRENKSASQISRISGVDLPATPGRFTVTNVPLRFIIFHAYELRAHELIGLPEWTESTPFDVTATYSPQSAPTDQDVRLMLRTLLADRFGLVMHTETRELPTYSLVLARKDGKLGPQLTRSDVDCDKWIAEKRPQSRAGGPSPVSPDGFRPACMLLATRQFLTGGTRTIEQLAGPLQAFVGRPVVDRTGLTGTFDIDLRWATSGDLAVTANAPPSDGPSIFTALQEQLGLKLEPGRAPARVFVIDKVERPAQD